MKTQKSYDKSEINERKTMGLAASQARLLTITARKADCEFQSMSLSHQKLSLARDMEKVSSDYQNALNTTKLVYDYYGSGDSDIALTYDLLMSPSVYNDYYPKLVTDAKNRCILNSAYADAARAAGIPAEGLSGTPSSDVRNKFIEALANENIITSNTAATVVGSTYGNTLGLGSTISVTQGTTNVTYDQLMTLLDANTQDSSTYGVLLGNNKSSGGQTQRFYTISADGNKEKVQDGDCNTTGNITLSDLLSGDTQYIIGYNSSRNAYAVDGAYQLQLDICEGNTDTGSAAILDWITDSFSAVLGGTNGSDTALQYAYNAVFDLIYPNSDLKDVAGSDSSYGNKGGGDHDERMETAGSYAGHTKGDEDFNESILDKTKDYLGMAYYGNSDTGSVWFHSRSNDDSTVALNLNNIAQVFLTAYVQYMEGIDVSEYSWQKGLVSESTLYKPENSDFEFTIVTETTTDEEDTSLYANFYDTLFNMICINGWTENAQIDDADYLSEMLKNGMAYISSISDDGYYYQGNYSTDRYILEVTDNEAIARAEAKYNTEKSKIENKEDTIDLKMKNLDTEVSSLTTEYDTTKSVISKSIEKSFKRYEA